MIFERLEQLRELLAVLRCDVEFVVAVVEIQELGEAVRCPEARAVRAEVSDDAFDRRAAGEGEACG